MNYLKVKIWGKEIGRIVWESSSRRTYFLFNPDKVHIPDVAPLLAPSNHRNHLLPLYGDDRPLYQGLPPFIADSLPDSWGNAIFDKWIKANNIPRNRVSPLYKLMFIGTRGMGALEYEPSADDLTHIRKVDIKSLFDLSIKILEDRDRMSLSTDEQLTLQALLAVGTSAGGRQMKAIIAINEKTGEIRSGQSFNSDDFEYHILKFGDTRWPIAEIEWAYHLMALASGITMEECRLFPVEGVNHFLTRRFDRKGAKKIHVQTLAAINPDARSYEDLVATCRQLSLPEIEIEQVFRRLVFNVMTNNTDDHSKNFAFLLEENGKWRLAPAYDVTFIFNLNGTGPNIERRLSIGGKTGDISKEDLLDFARQNDIRNAPAIISQIAEVIKNFSSYASAAGIPNPHRSIIRKTIDDNLCAFGYMSRDASPHFPATDENGREIEQMAFSVNAKGHIGVSVVINGKRRRKFIRPNMELYAELMSQDIHNLPLKEQLRLIGLLFPSSR